MPRHTYKSESKTISKQKIDELVSAIKAVAIEKKSQRAVSTSLNISQAKLSRYLAKLKEEQLDPAKISNEKLVEFVTNQSTKTGGKTIFSQQQENEMMEYILKVSEICYGLSATELKILAFQFAKKIGIQCPPSWNENGQASADWYYAFMHRNNLSLRTPEQITANHAKAFSKEYVDALFANLGAVLKETQFEPQRIWNIGETGDPTVPTAPAKVVAAKRVGQKTSAERGTTASLALAVNASEQSISSFSMPSTSGASLRSALEQNVALLHKKAEEKKKKADKKKTKAADAQPTKRRRTVASEDKDVDFCIICMGSMPNDCDRAVHLKCANMRKGYFGRLKWIN